MPGDEIKLSDEHRAKLDGIVNEMTANKESDDAIRLVVEDFKSKYALKKKVQEPTTSALQSVSATQLEQNIQPQLGGGSLGSVNTGSGLPAPIVTQNQVSPTLPATEFETKEPNLLTGASNEVVKTSKIPEPLPFKQFEKDATRLKYDQEQADKALKAPVQKGNALDRFHAGAAHLYSNIAEAPAMLWNTAAAITDPLANAVGIEGSAKIEQSNKISQHFKDIEGYINDTKPKDDKASLDYLKDGNIADGLGALGNEIAESLPASIGLMLGGVAGAGVKGTAAVGSLVFGADKKAELDANPLTANMPESKKIAIALGNGAMETLFEGNMGISQLGTLTQKILQKSGKEAAEKFAKEGFEKAYTPALKKWLGVGAENAVQEAATQFSQNVIDKYWGVDPDLDLSKGLAQAALQGVGAHAVTTTIPTAIEVARTKTAINRAKKIQESLSPLESDLASPDVTPEVKSALLEKINALKKEDAHIADDETKKFEALPEESKTQVDKLLKEMHDLTTTAADITLSDQTRDVLKDELSKVESKIETVYEIAHKERERLDKEAEANKGKKGDEVKTAEPIDHELEYLTSLDEEGIISPEEKTRLNELTNKPKANEKTNSENASQEGAEKNSKEEGATEEVPIVAAQEPNVLTTEQPSTEEVAPVTESTESVTETNPVVNETQQGTTNVDQSQQSTEKVSDQNQETKPVKEKPKQELIDEEEQIEARKPDDAESVKKLNDDIASMKQLKTDFSEKKYRAIIERAFKMRDEGKISRPTYTKYRNMAAQVLGGKLNLDAEEAKYKVSQTLDSIKTKLLGEGYKKITLSTGAPITPQNVADLIDLTKVLIHRAIDAGFTIKEATDKAMKSIKKHPTYKKLADSIDEKEFDAVIAGSVKPEKKASETKKPGKKKSARSLSKNLVESENLVEEAKDIIKKQGLDRDVYSHDEAKEKARELIDEVGTIAAMQVAMDKSSEVPGNIKGFLFGHIINDYNDAIKKAKTPEEKAKLAEMQAEAAINMEDFFIEFERLSTEAGRFIGSLGEFYKMSPLGIKKKMEKEIDRVNKKAKAKMRVTNRVFKDTKKALADIDKKYEKLQQEVKPKEKKEPGRSIEDIRKEREAIKEKLKASFQSLGFAATPENMSKKQMEQTKMMVQLAGNYLEEGIIHAKDLIAKINKDLKEFGYKLTDDDVTNIMDAEHDGKTIRERTEGQELEKKLADKKREEQLKVIEKAVSKKVKKVSKEKAKKEYEKMIDIWDKGVSGTEFEDAFYEKFGLANAREKEVQEKLDYFSEKIANAPEGVLQNKEKVAHLNWLTNYRTTKRVESGISYWYANILSSYETHLRNIQFNGVTGILAMPSLLAMKKIKKGDFAGAAKVFSEFFTSFGEGWQEAKATAKTGNISRFEDVAPSNALERGNKFAKVFTIPSRLLRAEDAFFTMSLYNAKQREIFENIVDQKAKEEGKKLSSTEREKAVNDLLGQTEERREAANEQANQDIEKVYGPDWQNNSEAKMYQKIRANEIIETSRPLEVRQDARAWAKKALLTNKPEGTFGVISDAVGNLLGEIPVLRAVIPFVNVPLNLVNQSIERSPLGLFKAYVGTTQPVQQLMNINKDSKYRREFTDDEKSELKIKAWNYTAAVGLATAAVALSGGFDDDDENAGLIITKLEGGYNRNQAIQKGGGLEPYSIYFGGKDGYHISYQNTPLASILSAVGAYRDYIKYGDDENKTTEAAIAKSFQSFLDQTIDQSSMKGLKGLLKYADPDERKRMSDEGWSKEGLKFVNALFPYSGLIKAGTKDIRGLAGVDSKKQTENIDYLTAGLPFDYYQNDKIDIFGRPIKEQASIPILPVDKKNFGQNGEDVDAMYKVLVDHNYDPTVKFIKNKTAYTDKLGEFTLSKQELYELNKLRGEIAYKLVHAPLKNGGTLWDKMKGMDNAQFDEYMDKALSTAKDMAVIQKFVLGGKLPEKQTIKKVYKKYKEQLVKSKDRKKAKVEVI